MSTKRELHFQKPYQFAKSEKYEPFCVSKLLFWCLKMGRSKFVEYRKVAKYLCYFEQNVLFLVKLNP